MGLISRNLWQWTGLDDEPSSSSDIRVRNFTYLPLFSLSWRQSHTSPGTPIVSVSLENAYGLFVRQDVVDEYELVRTRREKRHGAAATYQRC